MSYINTNIVMCKTNIVTHIHKTGSVLELA